MNKFILLIVLIVSHAFYICSMQQLQSRLTVDDFVLPLVWCPNDEMLLADRAHYNGITIIGWKKYLRRDPSIKVCKVPLPQRFGVCYDYAMKKLLYLHDIKTHIETPGCQYWFTIVPYCFNQIERDKIEPNDLIVHMMCDEQGNMKSKHFSLVVDPAHGKGATDIIMEGKWGTVRPIIRSRLFSLPLDWGNAVAFFRLKDEFKQDEQSRRNLVFYIKQSLVQPLFFQQILFNKRCELLNLANSASTKPCKVMQLLEQFPCVSVNQEDELKRTPLMLATINNNTGLVRLLCAYGACIEAKDMYDRTACMIAKENNFDDIIEILQKYTEKVLKSSADDKK